MRIYHHHYIHCDPVQERRLGQVLDALTDLTKAVSNMANEMEELAAQVAETKGVMQSAHVLIKGFAAALARAGTDPAKLRALAGDLKTDEDALAEAIAENPLPSDPPMPEAA